MSLTRVHLAALAALALLLSTPPACADPDRRPIVASTLSVRVVSDESIRARDMEDPFNGGFVPRDQAPPSPEDLLEAVAIFCGVHVFNGGMPVKGVPVRFGVDLSELNGSFERALEMKGRTNRQGDAFVATTLVAPDELLETYETSPFWAFVADPSGAKRVDQLWATCTLAEIRAPSEAEIFRPTTKLFREGLFAFKAPDPDCALDTQNLANGLPQVICPTDSYQFRMRDRCRRESKIEIQIQQTGQAPQGRAPVIITDMLTGQQFPTIQDRVAPGFDIFTKEELYRIACSF
jgi:hypothetical protein